MGQRVVRGRGRRAFPDDDLFVWCGRFDRIEPEVGDDGRRVARRADEAVRLTSRQVVEAWPTAALSPKHLPGASWEQSVREELSRFFQPSSEQRLIFGLEAEFRSSFPWSTRNGEVSLRYRGYSVTKIQRDAWTAEAQAQTLDAEIQLALEFVRAGREPEAVTISCVVSVPDDDGVFVLRGHARVFCPRLGAGLGHDDSNGFDDDDDDFELLLAQDPEETKDEDGAEDPSEPADDLDVEKDPPAGVYDNEGLTPLLRWVVGRKLRMLAATFASTPAERLDSTGAVLAWLGRYTDRQERLQLVARSVLWTYLRQPHGVHRTCRTIGVAPDAVPPAWACLELAPHLDVGQMAPVAGARLGPGGVITAPVPDGKGAVSLTAAEAVHPRLENAGDVDMQRLWICLALEGFAEVPAGRVAHPLALLEGGVRARLRVFVSPQEPEVLLVDTTALPREHVARRWTFEVPRHLDATDRMELLISPGTTVREGDLLARVSSGWADATFERHDLARVGAAIRNRSTKASRAEREQLEIRCPPGVTGLVQSVEVTTVHDLRGRAVRERLALVVSQGLRFSKAVLPDGRALPVWEAHGEDLPFDADDGARADAALAQRGGWPDAEEGDASSWYSGTLGARISGEVRDLDVWLLPPSRTHRPDPCLPARAVDGWGLPRSEHDPQITVGALRRLLVRHPEQAGTVFVRLHAWTGSPWATTSLFDLARACHLPPPPTVPADWVLDEEGRSPELYDPLRTRIHRPAGAPYRVDMGPWKWSCDCGELSETRYAQMPCAACGTTVKRRWIGLPHRSHRLALPILHPWRIELTAALLGLTGDELQQLARTEDCSPLYAATEAALEDPTRSLTRRLLDAELSVAIELQRQLQLVEDAVQRGVGLEDLWILELTLLSPRLLFDGYRTGAPDLTASPLTARYRKIEGLTSLGEGEPGSPMRRATWVELQKAVGDLFGEPTGTPEPGTLASLWSRAWPTTCDSNIPIAVPGLFESADGRDLRGSLVAKLMRSDVKADEPLRRLGLLGTEGVEPLDVPVLPRPGVGEPRAWKERAALAECWDARLPDLAALCLGIEEKPSIVGGLRGMDGAHQLEDAGSVGMVVLRELFRLLSLPEASPSSLLDLLTATLPLVLPRARDEALAKLDARLQHAVPGDAFAPRLVRGALGRALAGFWAGAPTPEHPQRWYWTQLADSAPPSYRRTVPRLGSPGWLIWPGVKMLCAPILAALEGWESGRTPAHAAWLGLEVPELPEDARLESRPPQPFVVAIEEAAAPVEPVAAHPIEAVEVPEPEAPEPTPAPEVLVRVLDITLDAWMTQQRRNDPHAQ